MNEDTQMPVDALKSTFRLHASGVAVITATSGTGAPIGFTATSVTSLGATPPLVSFNVARGSSSWPTLETASHVAMHTLGVGNLELAHRMAGPSSERFTGEGWSFGELGLPILEGVTSVLYLKIRDRVSVESNAVVICDVVGGFVGEDQMPLLYHQRGYVTVDQID